MRRVLLVVGLLFTVAPLVGPAAGPVNAAQPDSGTITVGGALSYTGQVSSSPPASRRLQCVDGTNCDVFTATADVPTGYYDSHTASISVKITWANKDADLNVYVCAGAGSSSALDCNVVASSVKAPGTTEETVVIANPSGVYRIVTAGASGGTTQYNGTLSFTEAQPPPTTRSTSGAFSWASHPVADASGFGEPGIDVDHAGHMFVVAPGGAGVQMWRSFDGGATFDHKEIGSAAGGGDSEIEFLSNDVGFTADLEIKDSAVTRSTDGFNTQKDQMGVGIEQDRQWFAHQCDQFILLAYHDFVAEAEFVTRSEDGGNTWPDTVLISTAPGNEDVGDTVDQGINTFQGPVEVDQRTGDVYVVFAISTFEGNLTTGTPPFGDPSQILVGVSHDKGKTFHVVKTHAAPAAGSLAGLIFPWLTVDRAGNVYVSWAGRDSESGIINVFLQSSTDHGETWSQPKRINTDAESGSHIYTTISGADAGVVDMAWYTGTKPAADDTDQDWFVDFAQIRNATADTPTVSQSRVYPNSIHHGDICLQGILCTLGGDRSLLDYFQVVVGPDGAANIAFANNQTPDTTQRVWYARQAAGPTAGNGKLDVDACNASVAATQTSTAAPGPAAAPGGTLPRTGSDTQWPAGLAAVLVALYVLLWPVRSAIAGKRATKR